MMNRRNIGLFAAVAAWAGIGAAPRDTAHMIQGAPVPPLPQDRWREPKPSRNICMANIGRGHRSAKSKHARKAARLARRINRRQK